MAGKKYTSRIGTFDTKSKNKNPLSMDYTCTMRILNELAHFKSYISNFDRMRIQISWRRGSFCPSQINHLFNSLSFLFKIKFLFSFFPYSLFAFLFFIFSKCLFHFSFLKTENFNRLIKKIVRLCIFQWSSLSTIYITECLLYKYYNTNRLQFLTKLFKKFLVRAL